MTKINKDISYKTTSTVRGLVVEFSLFVKGVERPFRVMNGTIIAGLQNKTAYKSWFKEMLKSKIKEINGKK